MYIIDQQSCCLFPADKWSDSLLSVNLQCIDVRDCEKKYANVLKASVEFRGGFGDTKLCTTDPQPDGKIIKDACNVSRYRGIRGDGEVR